MQLYLSPDITYGCDIEEDGVKTECQYALYVIFEGDSSIKK